MNRSLTATRWAVTLLAYAIPFAIVLAVAPFIGSEALQGNDIIRLRLPRVILGLLAGGGLALAGASFQVILRNPLAEPFTLGVTGGSAVGAVLALSIPALAFPLGPFSMVQILSLIGAALALALIYRLARKPHGISMNTLLLAGVTVSILSAGAIMFIHYLADPYTLMSMNRWLMGGLDVIGYCELGALLPFYLPGIVLLLLQMTPLNQLALGEEMAAGHGVEVASVQRWSFIGGGLLTAAIVSLTGPVGFVGLIIPHAVRRMSGFDQRIVLPASFFLGGAFLTACDTAARTLMSPLELPVGVVTALIGGPLFIKILLGKRR